MIAGPHNSYAEATASLELLGTRITQSLRDLFSDSPIALHQLAYRVKSRPSADRKLGRQSKAGQSYGDLHDLLGIRVITLFEDDIDLAAGVIGQVVNAIPERSGDRRDTQHPDRFGYLSRHFVGTLQEPYASLPENEQVSGRIFEVQLRSVLQHAWAEVEHDLGYKPNRPISPAIRRQFSILSAMMELADQQFAALRKQLEETESEAVATARQPSTASDLDLASLSAFVKTNRTVKQTDAVVVAAKNAHLVPPGKHFRKSMGDLLDVCIASGWLTITQLTDALTKNRASIVEAAKSWSDDRWQSVLPESRGFRPGVSLFILAHLAEERSASS